MQRNVLQQIPFCITYLGSHKFLSRIYIIIILAALVKMYFYFFKTLPKYFDTPLYGVNKPCKIHELDPWDKTLREYIKAGPTIHCPELHSLIFIDMQGYIQFNDSAILHYSLTALKCQYHIVLREDGDRSVKISDGVDFVPPTFVNGRIFRIVCKENSKILYDFIHANIAWNNSQKREDEIKSEDDSTLSILYFGIDSTSRSNALRQLPKSYKYLKETLNAYDFKGFMKVGLNTFPNLIPLLTGKESLHFPVDKNIHFDYIPFIWKQAAARGYATLYAEDWPEISTMNYLKPGFNKHPTDYYFRPYTLAMKKVEPFITKALGRHSGHCYGNQNKFILQIDYLKRFITKYTQKLKFAFFWNNQVGHNDMRFLGQADEPLYDFLKFLQTNGHLDRSVLIVGSDHGFRQGGTSLTYLGRLENNMPFLMLHIPPKLKLNYPWMHENLEYNTKMLSSAFDVNAFLLNVLNQNFQNLAAQDVQPVRTARNLLQKLPENRTCVDAGIPPQFCSCYEVIEVNTSHHIVQKLATYTVDYVNDLLKNLQSLCRYLTVKKVIEAKVLFSSLGDFDQYREGNAGSGRYILIVSTHPNDGILEIMIDYENYASSTRKYQMTVIGDVIRINRYGNQSHCIDNAKLQQYCLCYDIVV